MSLYAYAAGGSALLIALHSYFSQRTRSKLPLPPGPRKWPLVGNLFDMPTTFEWLTYMEWSKRYNSDVLHLNVAGTSIIVVSSAEAANELLEKRASLYSDRARLPMVNELMGWDFALAFMKYGEHWRAHRRLFHEVFNAVASQNFHAKEREVCHELLYAFLEKPDHDVQDHFRHMAAKIVLSVAYDIDVKPSGDPYVELADSAVEGLVTAVVPGRFLVDSIPLLKYVPAWFPGAGFQRRAREWRRLSQGMLEKPFAEAKQKIAKHPIRDRLPDFDDEPSLPYVAAVMKESLRWRNVAPISIPHFLPVDDEYRGYRLPGNSIVIPNTWAILHDEVVYPDPYSFKPERYLLNGELNPAMPDLGIIFGFGRRICPGRHMAHSSVWITLVSILAAFDITKAVGDDGEVIEPSYEYFAGLVVQPLPFKCCIRPRSEKAIELIRASVKKEDLD
ncbi:cytochrome P450 [Mycena epipterygia]|nr:cytochrome P450 [Mycena epipterygia]